MLLHSSLAKKFRVMRSQLSNQKGENKGLFIWNWTVWQHYGVKSIIQKGLGNQAGKATMSWTPHPISSKKFIISDASRFLKNENFCIIKCSRFYTMKKYEYRKGKKMLLDFTTFCNNNLPPVAAQLFFTHVLFLGFSLGVVSNSMSATPPEFGMIKQKKCVFQDCTNSTIVFSHMFQILFFF